MEKNYETLRIKFNKPLAEIDKEFACYVFSI